MAAILLAALAALAGTASPVEASDERVIVHPRSESRADGRSSYPLAILRLALDRAGRPYRLQPSPARMQQSRSLRMLEAGRAIDVAWSVTSRERESRLRAVRIPIDRGLIGWRLLLIRRDDAARFAAVSSPPDLAALRAGQGHDWPDLPVLRANGLVVESSPTYEGLFQMLARGHIDYFPRSLSEIGGEIASHAELPLAIEPRLLLHYPSALYFFVRRDDDELAGLLQRGLEASVDDGSLQREFDAYFGAVIASAGLDARQRLRLRNDDLPDATPLHRSELWFEPFAASGDATRE